MNNRLKYVFGLILAGLVFSGYLSGVKLFTDTCAFSESCPYFLGYPACWYGFGMYFLMFIFTSIALLGKLDMKLANKINIYISFVGIFFAGNLLIKEVVQGQATGILGLSTCAYGFIFYVLIFIFSVVILKEYKDGNE